MADFTANIECGFLDFEIESEIDDDGVFIKTVLWNGKPLLIDQEIYFIDQYGEDDLKKEIETQYDAWVKDQREDKLIEAWEIRQIERGEA